jgi:hypothetical protein
MRIVSPLIPRPEPPVAEPGAQTFFTEPKSPVAAALAVLVGAELPVLVLPEPTSVSVAARPHPAPTRPTTASDATARTRRFLFLLPRTINQSPAMNDTVMRRRTLAPSRGSTVPDIRYCIQPTWGL